MLTVEPLNKRKTSELEANTSSDSTDGDEYVQSSSEDDDALISECIENTIPEEELTPMSDEEKTGKAKPKKAKVDKPQVTKGKATTAKATTAKATKAKATKAKVTTTKVTTAKVTTAKATKPDSLREASKSKSNDDADHAVPADDGNTLPILALKANAPPKRGAAAVSGYLTPGMINNDVGQGCPQERSRSEADAERAYTRSWPSHHRSADVDDLRAPQDHRDCSRR